MKLYVPVELRSYEGRPRDVFVITSLVPWSQGTFISNNNWFFLHFLKQELQKDLKMKKAQGLKARDVLQGLQAIRDSIICLGFLLIQKVSAVSVIKHMKRARREKFWNCPGTFVSQFLCYNFWVLCSA